MFNKIWGTKIADWNFFQKKNLQNDAVVKMAPQKIQPDLFSFTGFFSASFKIIFVTIINDKFIFDVSIFHIYQVLLKNIAKIISDLFAFTMWIPQRAHQLHHEIAFTFTDVDSAMLPKTSSSLFSSSEFYSMISMTLKVVFLPRNWNDRVFFFELASSSKSN